MEPENNGPKPSNTEYNPIKCRTTRPPPPPPATNPLQFVKVGPCPLYKKAQEQIKKVEEVKSTKKHNADEMEEWQHNLDNWKNCRRKRQEHIIERVEEVKKIELESGSRSKRRSSTFDEIRKKRGLKINIPIYGDEDDTLNLSEYITTQSESDECRYSDSDNNNSIEDKKDLAECSSLEICDTDNEITTNERSEIIKEETIEKENNNSNQYTYEGAIEGYRSRICMNINVDKSIFDRPTDLTTTETTDNITPPKSILKRKELFESRKSIDLTENNPSVKLAEDLASSRSIKERLQSLKLCTDQQAKNLDKNEFPLGTVKSRLQKLLEINETKTECDKLSSFDSSNKTSSKFENDENINIINKDDFLNPNYQPSNSSVDLLTSSDREDSGIHTADVSCSVSQSDEAFEDADLSSNTIPKCIEKLNSERHNFVDDIMKVDVKLMKDYSYDKIITTEFLESEVRSACDDVKATKVVHSPLVENIKMYLRDEENILTKDELESKNSPTFNTLDTFDEATANVIDLTSCPIEYINDIFVNPLPSPKLKPPSEKPPPPPKPMSSEQRLDAAKRIKMERSSFLGIDNIIDEISSIEKIDFNTSNQVFLNHEIQNLNSIIKNGDVSIDKEIVPSVEDEITKREREIIELMEKEEKTKDKIQPNDLSYKYSPVKSELSEESNSLEDTFGSKKFDTPYFPQTEYDTSDEQYSEVLKVEQELLQLEREELKRQRENMLFEEKLLKNKNACENICDINSYYSNVDLCKSMPDLQQMPINNVNMAQLSNYIPNGESSSEYCKSMPDIQRAYNRSLSEYPDKTFLTRTAAPVRRQHYPEANFYRRSSSAPRSTQMCNSPKNMSPVKLSKSIDDPRATYVNINPSALKGRDKIQALNPLPRLSQNQVESWIHQKPKNEVKTYDQHWLYQEAELRRISEQKAKSSPVYNKTFPECNPSTSIQNAKGINYLDSNISKQRRLPSSNLEYVPHLCMPNSHKGVAYPSPLNLEEAQDIILSVSGKKKCSFCGNELGRGAAMIIESLHLFYHMECFRCCVCRVELGDGMMGIDVRVRNQKLHCHNCYSSEDGIKFSCV